MIGMYPGLSRICSSSSWVGSRLSMPSPVKIVMRLHRMQMPTSPAHGGRGSGRISMWQREHSSVSIEHHLLGFEEVVEVMLRARGRGARHEHEPGDETRPSEDGQDGGEHDLSPCDSGSVSQPIASMNSTKTRRTA